MTTKHVTKAVFAAHDAGFEPEPLQLEPAMPVEAPARKLDVAKPTPIDPGAEDVRRRMLRAGASAEFAEQVTGYVHRNGLRGAFAIDGAAEVLGKLFHRARSPRRGTGPARIVFFGPTGVGKTACVAKLGRKLAESGRAVAFASLDPLGLGSLERITHLEGDRDRTEVPLSPVCDAVDLEALLAGHEGLDVVLIDTPGVSPGDQAGLDELSNQLGRLADSDPIEGYLVLPANLERHAVEFAASAFSTLGPTAAIVTKLDETDAPGAALEAIQRRRLPVAFLSDGQDVRAHLVRPLAAHFADLFLRGRLGA